MLCSASRQRKINVWPQRSSPWIAIRVQDRTLALLCAVKLLPCCSSSGSPAPYSLLATYTDMSLILLSNGSFEDACQDRGRGWSRLYSPMNLHLEEFLCNSRFGAKYHMHCIELYFSKITRISNCSKKSSIIFIKIKTSSKTASKQHILYHPYLNSKNLTQPSPNHS